VLSKLDKLWRLIATALSFLIFGLGGLLIPLVIVPIILSLLPGEKVKRQQRGKALIHYAFRAYIWVMKSLGVLTYSIEGREKLKDAKLVLANHPTLIDVVFLISFIPNANCVVKSALLKNPFTKGPVTAAGYIVNDDSVHDVVSAAGEAFARNEALIVFPEGTRSVPGKPLTLKRGASNIALRTAADITPVIILCKPITLTKGAPWYKIPATRPHFSIRIADAIPIRNHINGVQPTVAARNLTEDLAHYFNKEIGFEQPAS
jgi:1-acyl-sn-glycerol-3-phosphate acyltransferase